MVYKAVVAYLGSLAYNDAHAVVYNETAANLSAGVDLDTGAVAAHWDIMRAINMRLCS